MMDQDNLYGIAAVGMVPLRDDRSDASEMVNQLLLGETFRVLELKKRWVKLLTDVDGYKGWANRNELFLMDEEAYRQWIENKARKRSGHLCGKATRLSKENRAIKNERILIPAGAWVVQESDVILLPQGRYRLDSSSRTEILESELTDTAKGYLGAPYLWGGRSDSGIDCSGLVQIVLALHGVNIPRDAADQFRAASCREGGLDEAQQGDLVYFNPSGKVTHVGFHLGNGRLLHAQGYVRINALTKESASDDIPYHERLAHSIAGVQDVRDLKGR